MFAALRTLVTRWFQSPPLVAEAEPASPVRAVPELLKAHQEDSSPESCTLHPEPTSPVPYEEALLERARTQWQFGDWQSLAQLNPNILQHHPDRAKLALLAAVGRLQTGQDAEAKAYIRLAQDWGVGKKLISHILIAGVHNSIGRAATIGNQQHRALQHFEKAIQIGSPCNYTKLLTQAQKNFQANNILFGSTYGKSTQAHILTYRDSSITSEFSNSSIHKKSEARENYLGIFEWKPEDGGHNFGDHLGILIAKMVYSTQSWQRITSGDIYIHAFVGSLLSNSNLKKMCDSGLKPVLIGCGFRGEKIDKSRISNCVILGCRGPLSRNALKEAGLDVPIVGDTAILLPLLLPANTAREVKNNLTILIPHILDKNRLNYDSEKICCDKIIQAVTYSLNDLEDLVYTIAGSKFVFAGAMHAAIVAYAYNVPFAFFDSKTIDCPPKWNDFAMSVGLSIEDVIFHSKLVDGIEWYEKVKSKLTKPDLNRLLKELAKIGDVNPAIIQSISQYGRE